MTADEFSVRLIRICIQARESQLDPAMVVGSLLGSAAVEAQHDGKDWSDFAEGMREQWDEVVRLRAQEGGK